MNSRILLTVVAVDSTARLLAIPVMVATLIFAGEVDAGKPTKYADLFQFQEAYCAGKAVIDRMLPVV